MLQEVSSLSLEACKRNWMSLSVKGFGLLTTYACPMLKGSTQGLEGGWPR